MTSAELITWRAKHDLNQAEAAQLLCTSRTQLARWTHGTARIPKYVVVFCRLLDDAGIMAHVKRRVGFTRQRRGRKPRA